eukprot:scaffold29624_cov30-Tisochrysis_lutea.AAC.4
MSNSHTPTVTQQRLPIFKTRVQQQIGMQYVGLHAPSNRQPCPGRPRPSRSCAPGSERQAPPPVSRLCRAWRD